MYELIIETHFGAAHRLRDYEGECENLHGHNWHVTVKVTGEELNELGMLMDFRDLKEMLNNALDRLDHKYLNEIEPFDRINPTTENLAEYVGEQLSRQLPAGVGVSSVTCWESDHCGARVTWNGNTPSAGGGNHE